MDIQERLLKVFRKVMNDEELEVEQDVPIDGVFDSITFITIVTEIEAEFDITIDDEELIGDAFTSFGSITKYLETRV